MFKKTKKLTSSIANTRQNKIILSIVVGLVAVTLLFVGLYASDPNKGGESALDAVKRESGYTETDFTVNPSDTVENETVLLEETETDIASNKTKTQELESQIANLQAEIADIKDYARIPDKGSAERVANPTLPPPPVSSSFVPSTVVEPFNSLPPEQRNEFVPSTVVEDFRPTQPQASLPPPPQANGTSESLNANNNTGNPNQSNISPKRKIQHISVSGGGKTSNSSNSNSSDTDNSSSNKSNDVEKNVSNYVPSGTFSKVVLLSGVDAPTGGLASSNPVPVLLRIKDKGTLANYFHSDLKECTAIGAAAGDISSERVNIRLESITCVLTDGRIIEKPIQGYVSGEDGKAGFRGRLVSKQGSLIAKSAMAGLASGFGSAVTDQYKKVSTSPLGEVTTIDPGRVFEAGASQGFGNAMETIADFYIKRANETYPIIEIASARVGDIVLTQGVDFGIDHIGKKRIK